ncbi:MAG TPA: CYTH and CHAD domain-containing protein [Pseudonocardia sp.]|jgi:CHAD domain-containing protein
MTNSIAVVRETERKYEADDLAPLDPAELLGMDTGGHAEEQSLEAVYYDTPDLRLLRAGITLRRRRGGSDAGWHLKLPAGADTRDELRLPLTRARRHPPADLAALTRVYSRGEPLSPVAQLDTRRRRWLLYGADGRVLAELVEDEVRAHRMGGSTEAVSWREVEVELSEHGDRPLLDRIEGRLLGAGARRSGSGSKLGRLLADRLAAAAPPVGAEGGSAGGAVLERLAGQAGRLRAYDPLVRRDAPDAVHQMRVAARRMRSILQAFGRVLDRGATAALVDELRWLGAELGPARDAEVIDEQVAGLLAALPGGLVLGEVAAEAARATARHHAEGRAAALAVLDGDRYLALHEAIDRLLADPPFARHAARPSGTELPRGVARAWRRTARRMAAVELAADRPGRDEALHDVRKAAKRLRYATEAAEPAVGAVATRLREHLKRVQTVLGEQHDAVVSRPVLRELAAQAHRDGGNGFTYGVLYAREEERAARAEEALPGVWAELDQPAVTRWLRRRGG